MKDSKSASNRDRLRLPILLLHSQTPTSDLLITSGILRGHANNNTHILAQTESSNKHRQSISTLINRQDCNCGSSTNRPQKRPNDPEAEETEIEDVVCTIEWHRENDQEAKSHSLNSMSVKLRLDGLRMRRLTIEAQAATFRSCFSLMFSSAVECSISC